MTYRERRERKAERLREWAAKREKRSAAAFKTARTIANGIPFGQPILVGHHSEKHHRRDVARIDAGMRAGVEHERKAAEMESRADNIEAAADAAIYSDDADAIERLRERIEGLEAERERVKAVNKAVRAHGLEALLLPAPAFELTAAERKELLTVARLCPYHQVEKKGFPAYHLQNLGGNITRNRKRLEQLERDREIQSRPGIEIRFPSKPPESVRDVLKARGFRWSRDRECWFHPFPSPDVQAFADYVNEHGDVPPDEPQPPEDPPAADTICPDGPSCPDPECIAERARRDVMQVIGAAYQAIDEERDPIAAVHEEIARVEAAAPAIADVPFSLTPVLGKDGGKQGGLF